jgi:DNA-binding response OmpR family regulator
MNALAQVVSASPTVPPPPAAVATAIRMADEGIPVRAIARSVRLPSEEVYEILRTAIELGQLVELPKDDWPTGTSRGQRAVFNNTPLESEEMLQMACSRCFKVTRLQAALLAVLLKRREVTKAQLHLVIEQRRPTENRRPTDPKMVDVIICHLRKKLKQPEIEIKTVWGTGYRIPLVDREKAIAILTDWVENEA